MRGMSQAYLIGHILVYLVTAPEILTLIRSEAKSNYLILSLQIYPTHSII